MATAEEVLAQSAKAYQSAERFNKWQPPNGHYLESIEAVQISDKCFGKYNGVIVLGRIQEGEFDGKVNVLGTFTEKSYGRLADFVEMLGGEDQPTALAAKEFLDTKIGTVVNVEISRRPSSDGTKIYANADVIGVAPDSVAGEVATEGDDTDTVDEDAPEDVAAE